MWVFIHYVDVDVDVGADDGRGAAGRAGPAAADVIGVFAIRDFMSQPRLTFSKSLSGLCLLHIGGTCGFVSGAERPGRGHVKLRGVVGLAGCRYWTEGDLASQCQRPGRARHLQTRSRRK